MSTGINVTKPIKILDEGVLLTSDVSQIDFTGGVTATTVGNNVTVNVPAAGITVGTTPVTSGTDTRVFFQAGGVVQQDANFTFDNTLKRLTLKAVGTAGTDIPFQVLNSAATAAPLYVRGTGTVEMNPTNSGAGTLVKFTYDANGASNVTYGTPSGLVWHNFYTPYVYSSLDGNNGYEGRIDLGRYNGAIRTRLACTGDSFFQFSNLVIGAQTAGARLDVRAQGALSTDIAFRVRNSADSADLVSVQGDGYFGFGASAFSGSNRKFRFSLGSNANLSIENPSSNIVRLVAINDIYSSSLPLEVNASSYNFQVATAQKIILNSTNLNITDAVPWVTQNANGTYLALRYAGNAALNTIDIDFNFNTTTKYAAIRADLGQGSPLINSALRFEVRNSGAVVAERARITGSGNLLIGTTSEDTSSTKVFIVNKGTAPSTNITASFQLYSADITAGNAAPHFRTENGAIVKVYQETTAVAASTLVGGVGTPLTDTDTFDGYTLKQIVKALRNQGLLA